MSACIKNVLIIGGGFSGMSAAIEMRKAGIDVDLVEIDPNWRTDGAGISISGPTMRAFKQLGILDDYLKYGSSVDGLEVFAPTGEQLAYIPSPPIGDGLPTSGAIMRPALAKILSEKTQNADVTVKLGVTFENWEDEGNAVSVTFNDNSTGRYDLVIGADGVYSDVRTTLFPEADLPKYIGQGVWRAVLPRLSGVNNTMMWVGQHVKIGVNPMSSEQMYMFVTNHRASPERPGSDMYLTLLKGLLAPFPAQMVQQLTSMLDENCHIDYRPLERVLKRTPWYRGRIVLIGDTVHATTPHLASGACIGIEDAIVLVDELCKHTKVDHALEAFQSRRWERCRMVVENSGRLAEIEIQGGDKEEHRAIMRDSAIALTRPV